MQGWSESMSWESPWAEHSAPEIGDVNQQGFHFPEKHCDLFMYIYIYLFLYIPTQYWPNVGLSQHDSQYVSICRISSIYLHILHTTHIYNIYIMYIYTIQHSHGISQDFSNSGAVYSNRAAGPGGYHGWCGFWYRDQWRMLKVLRSLSDLGLSKFLAAAQDKSFVFWN